MGSALRDCCCCRDRGGSGLHTGVCPYTGVGSSALLHTRPGRTVATLPRSSWRAAPAFFFCSLYVVAVPASNRPHSQLQFRTAIHRSAQPVNSTKSCLNAANEDFTYKWANCLQPIWCIFLRIFFYQVFFTDSIDVLPDIYLAMQREHFSCLSWPS